MRWITDQWEQIRGNFKYEVLRYLVFAFGLTALAAVVRFWRRLRGHQASSLELILTPLIGLVLMICYSLYVNKIRGDLNLLLTPSSGPGAQQILVVKNLGKKDTFSAFCEITGNPNDVNDFRRGESRCGWGDGSAPRKTIPHGESETVLIASFSEVVRLDLSEMTLWEVVEGKKNVKGSFRWNQHPHESLPRFILKIRFTSENTEKSRTYQFSVGPYSYRGPLEMTVLDEHTSRKSNT